MYRDVPQVYRLLVDYSNQEAVSLLSVIGGAAGPEIPWLIFPLSAELLVFGIHVVDRLAIASLPHQARCELLADLFMAMKADASDGLSDGLDLSFARRLARFGECYVDVPGATKAGQSLFAFFGKEVCGTYGRFDPSTVASSQALAADFYVKVLNGLEAAGTFSSSLIRQYRLA